MPIFVGFGCCNRYIILEFTADKVSIFWNLFILYMTINYIHLFCILLGVSQFCAVINPPQSCILAIGTTSKKLLPDPDSLKG